MNKACNAFIEESLANGHDSGFIGPCEMLRFAILAAVGALGDAKGMTDLSDRINAAIEAVEDQDNHAALVILRTILAKAKGEQA